MFLSQLSLENYRNFLGSHHFVFDEPLTLIIGNNAVGKTNMLEAIYYINAGHGFREKKQTELFSFGTHYFSLEAVCLDESNSTTFGIRLEQKKQTPTKTFFINKLAKPHKEFRRRSFSAVLFQPSDLQVLTDAPTKRRTLVDRILGAIDYGYYQAKINYERGLYKRNKILEQQSSGVKNFAEVLEFWDSYLLRNAHELQRKREELVKEFNKHPELQNISFQLVYEANTITPQQIVNLRAEELKQRRTLWGPQLDDFSLHITNKKNSKHVGLYGSRSEQRLGILWFKMNEARYCETFIEAKPIILLDDIFSELDEENGKRILTVFRHYQVFLTTADPHIQQWLKTPHTIIQLLQESENPDC